MAFGGDLLIAVITVAAGAVGSVATVAYQNRKKISSLMNWAWGAERDPADDGISQRTESLDERLSSLESKIDAQSRERKQGISEVKEGMRKNRAYFRAALLNLTNEINRENGFEIAPEDIEPDWSSPPFEDRDGGDGFSTD